MVFQVTNPLGPKLVALKINYLVKEPSYTDPFYIMQF